LSSENDSQVLFILIKNKSREVENTKQLKCGRLNDRNFIFSQEILWIYVLTAGMY